MTRRRAMGIKARETDPAKIAQKRRAYESSYREQNREMVRSKNARYAAANRDVIRERMKLPKYRAAGTARTAAWYARNREIAIEKKTLRRQSLPDGYIIHLLKLSTPLPPDQEFPPELIETKRQHLKLKRLLKEKQK